VAAAQPAGRLGGLVLGGRERKAHPLDLLGRSQTTDERCVVGREAIEAVLASDPGSPLLEGERPRLRSRIAADTQHRAVFEAVVGAEAAMQLRVRTSRSKDS